MQIEGRAGTAEQGGYFSTLISIRLATSRGEHLVQKLTGMGVVKAVETHKLR